MKLSKDFYFEAAHKLEFHKGKCKNLHGHSYKVVVEVEGGLDKDGMVIDFDDIKKIVNQKIIKKLDHSYLNDLIKPSTAEKIAIWVWDELKTDLSLSKVEVWETKNSRAIYEGKEAKKR